VATIWLTPAHKRNLLTSQNSLDKLHYSPVDGTAMLHVTFSHALELVAAHVTLLMALLVAKNVRVPECRVCPIDMNADLTLAELVAPFSFIDYSYASDHAYLKKMLRIILVALLIN
jgi:hypothetical protein